MNSIQIGTPDECPKKCQHLLSELVAELWTRYDIEEPQVTGKKEKA